VAPDRDCVTAVHTSEAFLPSLLTPKVIAAGRGSVLFVMNSETLDQPQCVVIGHLLGICQEITHSAPSSPSLLELSLVESRLGQDLFELVGQSPKSNDEGTRSVKSGLDLQGGIVDTDMGLDREAILIFAVQPDRGVVTH